MDKVLTFTCLQLDHLISSLDLIRLDCKCSPFMFCLAYLITLISVGDNFGWAYFFKYFCSLRLVFLMIISYTLYRYMWWAPMIQVSSKDTCRNDSCSFLLICTDFFVLPVWPFLCSSPTPHLTSSHLGTHTSQFFYMVKWWPFTRIFSSSRDKPS